jgi:hypothetical protein
VPPTIVISDDEEPVPRLEDLQRRHQELKQACSPHCRMNL